MHLLIRGVVCWGLGFLLTITSIKSLNADSVPRFTPEELLARVCDCNRPSRNCNPYNKSSFIQCASTGDLIKDCRPGQLYDFVRKRCVPEDDAENLCEEDDDDLFVDPEDPEDDEDDEALCSTECFCEGKIDGRYPNPFDAFCQSFITCQTDDDNVAGVDVCDIKERYNPDTQQCEPAANVACLTASGVNAPVDSCSEVECFCEFRAAGLYDNPFDFDANSAIECGTCGTFINVWIGRPGYIFNGRDFIAPTPTNPKPQLCGQITGGVKVGSLPIAEILWAEIDATSGRKLKNLLPLPGSDMATALSTALLDDAALPAIVATRQDAAGGAGQGSTDGTKCGRSLLATVPQNAVQAVPVSGCSSTLRCPAGSVAGSFRVVRCRLVKCQAGCGILASSRNYCSTTTG